MIPRAPFSKDIPASSDSFAYRQQLPPVSHILGGSSYDDLAPVERPASQQGLAIFHGPHFSRGNSGESTYGSPGFYRRSSQTHYHQRSDVLPTSTFSQSTPHQDQIPHNRSIHSLLSRYDERASSGSDVTTDPPRAPRVLREEDLPGKGVCYIYDDGTYCPKAIDGDSVNLQWGVTKAGKPRKRLAQACTTCREKKIRCDPGSGLSQCSQCLKFNRECKFEQQQICSRSSQRSPSVSTTDSPAVENSTNTSPIFHRNSAASTEQSFMIAPSSKTSLDIGHSTSALPFLNHPMNGDYSDRSHSPKRMKPSAPSPDVNTHRATQLAEPRRRHSTSTKDVVDGVPAHHSPVWEQDPFEFGKSMTEYYLHQYFTRVNCTIHCILPQGPFMEWVRTCREKTVWDKMLLYAMMAHGTIFATNSRKNADGKTFSRIAHHAIGESAGVFNLQVVQTRLILSLYDFSQGSTSKAWDFTGSAVRAVCGMRLNVEEEVIDIKDDQNLVYGFEKATVIECRRRTFWSAYIMDRFNGFCSGHVAMLHNEDCLLRLPCDERMYEEGNIPITPFFDSRKIDAQQFIYSDSNALGMMAHLVQMASIWGEVLARAYRSRYQPPSASGVPFEEFYQQTMRRLEAWERSLGAHLRYSPGNMDKASQSGYLGTYGALHTLYNCTMMKLNRHARYDRMQPQQVNRNVKCAYEHACKTLDMMKAVAKHNRSAKCGDLGFAVSSPFTGFAVLTAMDILTATGSLADLLNPGSRSIELLAGGIDVMTELSEYWSSAKTQLKLVERRFEDLMATVQSHGSQQTTVTAFFARDPLETTFGMEHDLVYALPKRQYLEALGWGSLIKDGDEMLEVLKRGSSVNTVPLSSTNIWGK